jgi:hypothetical protein
MSKKHKHIKSPSYSRMDMVKDKEIGFMKTDILAIFLIILTVVFSCLPLFKNISNINLHTDWLQMCSYYRSARQAVLIHHQFPLRTYFFGGGYPLIANPQDGFLSPFFIPVLILGEVIGLKLNILLAHFIALFGMYYLARYVLKYNYLGASFSTLVFCLGGHIHRLLIRGQDYVSTFYCFFIPLVMAFFLKSKEHKKYLFFTVFTLTVISTQAGLYFTPILLLLFLFSCLEAFKYKNNGLKFDLGYLKNFFVIIFFVLMLGAVKIFPMFELLRQNLRSVEGYNPFWGPLFINMYKSFFVHQKDFASVGEHWNYFYLGYVPICLSLVTFFMYWKKMWKFAVLLGIFILLSFSAHTRFDLFGLLWRLPIFHSIEAPTRYFVPVVIFIIALTSGGFFSIRQKFKNKFTFLIFTIIIIFTAADLFYTNGVSEASFPQPIPKNIIQPELFCVQNYNSSNKISTFIPKSMHWLRSWEFTLPNQYELMLQNIGKINWYGNIHLKESVTPKYYIEWNNVESFAPENFTWRINPAYKGELYFLNNSNNKAEFTYFSPNKIVVKINLSQPDILIINQNYDKYWRSSLSRPINNNGLLAVNLDKEGEYLVKFDYVPSSFYFGLVVTLITFIFIIYYLWIL